MNESSAMPLRRLQARFRDSGLLARAPLMASILLVILIAYTTAGLTWSLIAPAAPVTATAPVQATRPAAAPDPERVASRHLFGRADSVPGAATVDAPETRLNLTLRGISASGSAAFARAVIAGPDGRERVYSGGAEVPGGAVVHEIHADRVILNRRGTLETLRLPRLGGSAPPTAASAVQMPTPVAVDNLRDQAATEQLAEFIRPQAVMVDGQLRGYRVYPGRDRQRFASMGLRAGDLVTAINGVSLSDPARGLEAMQALTTSGEVLLTIQRGDQIENITVPATR